MKVHESLSFPKAMQMTAEENQEYILKIAGKKTVLPDNKNKGILKWK